MDCAVDHWKQRALRAEYLLTLIPIPSQNADVDAFADEKTLTKKSNV